MGTRATVHIYQGNVHLVSLYKQSDGYPAGLGVELAEFILGGELINGIFDSANGKTQFNGAGCFAAALIAKLKEGPGRLYVSTKDDSQEYDYTIRVANSRVEWQGSGFSIACRGGRKTNPLPPAEFLAWADAKT